jgi:signal transduction histidine kinase
LPEALYGDGIRLKQILINLVKNALKFTKRGYIKVLVAFNNPSGLLEVHVVDSGKGITIAEKENLFKMFGKLKRTANQNSEGIGMGLVICRQLVEANRGTITVHSKGKNKGCSFIFTMKMNLPGGVSASEESRSS